MRWPLLFVCTIGAFSTLAWFYSGTHKNLFVSPAMAVIHADEYRMELVRLKDFGNASRQYVQHGNFNDQYCFLIDMKLPSGSNRFFIYDMKKDSVLHSGLVAHGSGSDNGSKGLYFSNIPGSNCTSLGKYRIGKAYHGKFGLAYKLYGLDKTNSQAFDRFVVLHAHACVPLVAVAPQEICMSSGCPTVAPVFLAALKGYLDNTEKTILLWIFY